MKKYIVEDFHNKTIPSDHDEYSDALKEAQRRCLLHPGVDFFVFETKAIVHGVTKVVANCREIV